MSNYIGGYVLVPISQGVSLADVAQKVSDKLLLAPRLGLPPDGATTTTPVAQLLTNIEHVHQGSADFLIGGIIASLIFETPMHIYHSLRIAVDEALFNRRSARWNPATLETFAEGWAQVCEAVQAEYGYFSPYMMMAYEEYLQEDVLPYLTNGDAKSLIDGARSAYWLSYHSLRFVDRWPTHADIVSLVGPTVMLTTMPSGAVFLRNDEQKPINTK